MLRIDRGFPLFFVRIECGDMKLKTCLDTSKGEEGNDY
jgi:hypothetical protein